MPRTSRLIQLLLAALLLAAPWAARADLAPQALGEFVRETPEAYEPGDGAIYAELGLEEAETAVYRTPSGKTATLIVQQFYDDTGAFAAFLWEQSAEGYYSGFGERSWTDDESTLIHFANYLVRFSGDPPQDDHIELMLAFLPRVRPTADPPVLNFRPGVEIRPGTQKYILGPAVLEKLAPEISPSIAGFHFGAEAHYAVYETESGPLRMLLFSYPTPQMARAQADEFYKLENVVAKRSGPMIGVVVAPGSADGAQRLLAKFRYAAEVTMDYTGAKKPLTLAEIVLDTFMLVGVLAGLCIVGGVFVGGVRYLAGRVAPTSIFAAPEGDGLVHLGLDGADEKRTRDS